MRYAYKVFDEIYYFSNKYNDPVFFSHLFYYVKYKLEDRVDDGFRFQKTQKEILDDFKVMVEYLVDELKDFNICYWSETNEQIFEDSKFFFKYIDENKINYFDLVAMNLKFGLIKTKTVIIVPTVISEKVHSIFEKYLFCDISSSVLSHCPSG